jgi:hypothetical protein
LYANGTFGTTHGFGAGYWQMMWRRVGAVGVAGLAGLLFVAMLFVGYMMFLDGTAFNPPVIYETLLLQTDRTEYAPGATVSVLLDVYKARDIKGYITWSLVNGRVFPYASRCLPSPSGTYEKWFELKNEKLPTANLEPPDTTYHFEALVEYRVNPLRVVTYKLKTTPFKISHKGDDG